MRQAKITPVTTFQVTPTVYLDVDMTPADEHEAADEVTDRELCQIVTYPELQCLRLADIGPRNVPVYRVEGPLSVVGDWLLNYYHDGDATEALDDLSRAKLAAR
jgi:hypothetical protein